MPRKWKCASSPIRRLFGRSGFSGNIPWKWRRNCKHISLFRSLKVCTSLNLCVCEDSGHEVGCAEHSCQIRLNLERAHWHFSSDCGRWTPKLGHCYRVCELRTAIGCANWGRPSRRLFTRDKFLLKSLLYPSKDCFCKWGFPSINFMAKSVLSLHHGRRPNKRFHNTHTHTHARARAPSVTPHLSKSTNFEGN